MRVAIRADGGKNIGMGHIMRCLSLAKEFSKLGIDIVFITKFDEGYNYILSSYFKVIKLKCESQLNTLEFNYGNLEDLYEEAKYIINEIIYNAIDILIIDTYNVSEKYFLSLKPHVKKLVYIDDVNRFTYPVDILINGNIGAENMEYKKYYDNEILLLGTKYNLIRDEFRNLSERIVNREVKEIMITTGGTDPYNINGKLTKILLEHEKFNNIRFNIVVGNAFLNKDEIRQFGLEFENVKIYENVKKISEVMLRSDIAISSGGSTLYELCACGTPTLAFIMADNQELIVKNMGKSGYVKSLGWFTNISNTNLINELEKLITDFEYRSKVYIYSRELIDANGTKRILSTLCNKGWKVSKL